MTGKIRTLLAAFYAYHVEYRADLLLWTLAGVTPFISMGLWIEAADSARLLLGPVEFARYFLAVFVVRQLTIVWVIWDLEREVLEGRLSARLLLPIDPVWHHAANHVAERLVRLPSVALLVLTFFLLYPQAFWLPGPGRLVLFALALSTALLLRFIMQYTLAMAAFWTERAASLEELWHIPYLFLSGMIAPLEVFPPIVREVALWTPFPYLVYFPANLLVGTPVRVEQGLAVTALWCACFFLLNRLLWRRGLKRYSAMGA